MVVLQATTKSIMKKCTTLLIAILLTSNLFAQSGNGIGIDLIGSKDNNLEIGLRYEHEISGKFPFKLGLSYNGESGFTPTIGYQFMSLGTKKFKLILGMDYSLSLADRDLLKPGLQVSHTLSLPIEARFKLSEKVWLNVGMSPSYNFNKPSGSRISTEKLRIGAIYDF